MDTPRTRLDDTTLSGGQEPAVEPTHRDVSASKARLRTRSSRPGDLPLTKVEPSAPGQPFSDASLRSLARLLGIRTAKAHRRRGLGGSVVQIAIVLAIIAALLALMMAPR